MKRAPAGRYAPIPTYDPDLPRRHFAKEGLRTKTMAVDTGHSSFKSLRPKGHAMMEGSSGNSGRVGDGVTGTSLIAVPAIGEATSVAPALRSVPQPLGSDTPKPPPAQKKVLAMARLQLHNQKRYQRNVRARMHLYSTVRREVTSV